MEEYIEILTKKLLEKNNEISYEQAQTCVELLWGDFEATYAKAGHKYAGKEMTFRVVDQWIDHYGEKLYEFISRNPKYSHFIK